MQLARELGVSSLAWPTDAKPKAVPLACARPETLVTVPSSISQGSSSRPPLVVTGSRLVRPPSEENGPWTLAAV